MSTTENTKRKAEQSNTRYRYAVACPYWDGRRDEEVNMNAALASGNVYIVDKGYSGRGDGEYHYIVPVDGFTLGCRRRRCRALLVNAKGERAAGYEEEPQIVVEHEFRSLTRDERITLHNMMAGMHD